MFQFVRLGYFCVDRIDSSEDRLVFNRTVSLKTHGQRLQKKKLKILKVYMPCGS